MKIKFEQKGDFVAYHAACDWCNKHGISRGSMQRTNPIGLFIGDASISKWDNMTRAEQNQLHGEMITTNRFRNGPVMVKIKPKYRSLFERECV